MLAEGIRGYRQHVLFIPNTQFHRSVCAYLHDTMQQFTDHTLDVGNPEWLDFVSSQIYDLIPAGHIWNGKFFAIPMTSLDRTIKEIGTLYPTSSFLLM
jgi:hypothetical protein